MPDDWAAGQSFQPPLELHGLSWETLRDILSSPAATHRTIIRMACHLAETNPAETTIQKMAISLKTTEITILEAVSRMPTLFKLFSAGHRVRLLVPADHPDTISPRKQTELDKRAAKERRTHQREIAEAARDDEETTANDIMRKLERLGMIREDSRPFSKMIVSNYSAKAALQATDKALEMKPSSPRPYILSLLRNASERGTSQSGRTVRAHTKPTGDRETVLIGWSSYEPREKLYRLPDGRLKKVQPATGEKVPTLEEDSGYRIEA